MGIDYMDTHAHLDDNRLSGIIGEVLNRACEVGVKYIIAPGIDLESSVHVRKIADRFPRVFFAPGIHCHEANKFNRESISKIKGLLDHPKAVAVGEIGLDYHYDFSPPELQKKVFRHFLELALEMSKPVIIHCREAEEDLYSILSSYKEPPGGVIHCYTGNAAWAEKFLELGYYIGFTGVITFKNSGEIREVVKITPLERILTETDSPYMTPVPHRNVRPNEPRFIPLISAKIAELKYIEEKEAASIFLENAMKCFGIEI